MKTKKQTIVALIGLTVYLTTSPELFGQDGTLDLNFDTDGIVFADIGNSNNSAFSLVIQPDGKIVAAGVYFNGNENDFALMRFESDGSPDITFDTNGIAITQVGTNNDNAFALALQSDGKILAAGNGYGGSSGDFALVRYLSSGILDSTFDGDGMIFTDFNTNDDYGRSLVIQPDGKIIVAGYCFNVTDIDIAVARYLSDGSLDTTFNNDGKVITPIGNNDDWGRSVALQTDGKIVVAGYSFSGINMDMVIVRYLANGSLDTSFNNDGIVTLDIGSFENRAHSVIIQQDGKIVIAGFSENGVSSDYALARFTSNGMLDSTFNSVGIVTTDIANFSDEINSLIIQSDGKLVATGYSVNGSNYEFSMAKYHSDGSLDLSFDSDGKITTYLTSNYSYSYSAALQTDGKIVAAGSATLGFNADDFALVRYNNSISTGLSSNYKIVAELKIFPNPFIAQTSIHLETDLQNASAIIYNVHGVKVKELLNLNGKTISFYDTSLTEGIYFIHLIQDKTPLAQGKLIKFN
jgi:uncharacterized delta-60 repeat protein